MQSTKTAVCNLSEVFFVSLKLFLELIIYFDTASPLWLEVI